MSDVPIPEDKAADKHPWGGRRIKADGDRQACSKCHVLRGFFSPEAAAQWCVDTKGQTVVLYLVNSTWQSTVPPCRE